MGQGALGPGGRRVRFSRRMTATASAAAAFNCCRHCTFLPGLAPCCGRRCSSAPPPDLPLLTDPEKEAGDVVPEGFPWARYPDGYDVWLGDGSTKQVGEDELILGKTWKLNAERNNGRAAMMGITGMLIHESLTGNPVFPIGETL